MINHRVITTDKAENLKERDIKIVAFVGAQRIVLREKILDLLKLENTPHFAIYVI